MAVSVVLTIIGADRPGLVESLSDTLAAHGGNWLESRMSHLAGKFAGILHASVPEDRCDALFQAFEALQTRGLKLTAEKSSPDEAERTGQPLVLQLVGADHAGIIRDVSAALAGRGINVEELDTELTSAPMSGETLFRATIQLRLPGGTAAEDLRSGLEDLANDLMVDIDLVDSPGSA